MAIFVSLVGGYVLKQKYSAYKAESKLQDIETKIAKTKVLAAKQVAEARADSKEIEASIELDTLRELQKEKIVVLKEMDEIAKVIKETQDKTTRLQSRTRGPKVSIDI